MKFGITQEFECSYIPEQSERLLVCLEPTDDLKGHYSDLIQLGFRRSGEQIYRPNCKTCNACESLRILTREFVPSKSQKRILSKNRDLKISFSEHAKDDYYLLYEQYINHTHSDGSMYPASLEQYESFIFSCWNAPLFLEIEQNNQLVGVAVTDKVENGLSALYTFYDPTLRTRSLGKYLILKQIALCRSLDLSYLYLGYQIDECDKMNYKTQYKPYQRFIGNSWRTFHKHQP